MLESRSIKQVASVAICGTLISSFSPSISILAATAPISSVKTFTAESEGKAYFASEVSLNEIRLTLSGTPILCSFNDRKAPKAIASLAAKRLEANFRQVSQ